MILAIAAVAIVVTIVLNRQLYGLLREYAQHDVELIQHLRRTMEDLRSRDPQIADMLEIELLELDRQEPIMAALARGDYAELRRLRAADR